MLSKRMTALALGASAALSLAGATAAHAQVTIGVAANFGATVFDLIDAFGGFTEGTAVNIDSTGVLRTCILTPSTAANFTTNCPFGHYDLFLAADTTTPAALVSTNPSLGMFTNGTTQGPFFYATGSLELYSPITSQDINAGLPETSTLSPPALVIANPSAAPYGLAAMTVINTYHYSNIGTLTTGSSYPVASLIFTEPNIGVTFESIVGGDFAYGFVHKSAICRNFGSGEVLDDGNGANNLHHHEYLFSDTTHGYPQIVQSGLPIELGQSNTLKGEVMAFIDYLHGAEGQGIIQSYCYGTTPPSSP